MGLFSRRQRTLSYPAGINITSPGATTYPQIVNQSCNLLPQLPPHPGQPLAQINSVQQLISQDDVTDQFSEIVSHIDEDHWVDTDEDLTITIIDGSQATQNRYQSLDRALSPSPGLERAQGGTRKVTIRSRLSHYRNSRLPNDLPLLKVYIPTWPLICLAAQYSKNAYRSPQDASERSAFVSADSRLGTKAMVMKSVPCDEKKTLVFAIRGTSTLSLRDWNVNLHTSPVSPLGFLDDSGNLCHAGFLRVAKAMVKPIAMRLRSLLEENPSRAACSLLITGHSAGGAVAALLYMHMLSSQASELSILTDCFKRVHCITFGAPPVSLLPLAKPAGKTFAKSLFFSFINEGDPVVRAEKSYIRSLVDLLSTNPNPALPTKSSFARLHSSMSKLDLTSDNRVQPHRRHRHSYEPEWTLPAATLSNSGRLVVMRLPAQPESSKVPANKWEKDNLSKVTAHTATDDQMRRVIFGDPSVHAMELYLRRVDMLALKAVTARA